MTNMLLSIICYLPTIEINVNGNCMSHVKSIKWTHFSQRQKQIYSTYITLFYMCTFSQEIILFFVIDTSRKEEAKTWYALYVEFPAEENSRCGCTLLISILQRWAYCFKGNRHWLRCNLLLLNLILSFNKA